MTRQLAALAGACVLAATGAAAVGRDGVARFDYLAYEAPAEPTATR